MSNYDDNITVIEGVALTWLLVDLGNECGINLDPDGNIRKISIQERGEGLAYKINEGLWTPTLSTKEED